MFSFDFSTLDAQVPKRQKDAFYPIWNKYAQHSNNLMDRLTHFEAQIQRSTCLSEKEKERSLSCGQNSRPSKLVEAAIEVERFMQSLNENVIQLDPTTIQTTLREAKGMEKGLQLFTNSEFGELNILIEDGKELFPASDCAKMLGYSNPRKAIIDHCKGVTKRDGVSLTTNQHGITTQQITEMNYIPEGDLFRLIVKSNLPAADKFERWVFDEVLPSIRKHGAYMTPDILKQSIENPDFLIGLLTEMKLTQEKVKALEPKAEYFDAIVDRNLLVNFRDTAKELKIQQKVFINWLIENRYIYRDKKNSICPYAEHVPALFEMKEWADDKTSGV